MSGGLVSSRILAGLLGGGPVGRQELVQAGGLPAAAQLVDDIDEPGARVDTGELAGGDERVEGREALAASVRAGEQPVVPAEGDVPELPLGGVVRQPQPAVDQEL